MASSSNPAQGSKAPLRKTWCNPDVDASIPWQKSKVMILYLNGPSFLLDPPATYLGPVMTLSGFPEDFRDSFPNKECQTDILASAPNLYIHYFLKSSRIFRTPPLSISGYSAWLARVEAKKAETWKKQGIYHLIKLSEHTFRLDRCMLGAAVFFWSKATNNFYFPCGMMGPILFDVAALTDLPPDGHMIHPLSTLENIIDVFSDELVSFLKYISSQMQSTAEISDEEHVPFLFHCFSAFVIFNKNVQMSKALLDLANLLHEGKRWAFGSFLLSNLYLSMSSLYAMVKGGWKKVGDGGPIWLLQLWLNATFPGHTVDKDPSNLKVDTYGTLAMYHALKPFDTELESFTYYFKLFHSLSPSTPGIRFQPFVGRKHGLEWFTNPFDPNDKMCKNIRIHFLACQVFPAGLPGSTDNSAFACLSNASANNFGFMQSIPFRFGGHLLGDKFQIWVSRRSFKKFDKRRCNEPE